MPEPPGCMICIFVIHQIINIMNRETDIVSRLKEFRSRKGFSQEHLAEAAGLSLRTIQRIENGETTPRGDSLQRIAMALQVSPDELIDWQVMEDRNLVLILQLSQFGFLAFPILGIIIPLVIWIFKKDKVVDIDQVGKKVINFQITWTILVFAITFLLTFGAFAAPTKVDFEFPITVVAMAVAILYLYNITFIMVNVIRYRLGKRVVYKPSVNILY